MNADPTQEQAAAIASNHPRILVVSGPGGGKSDAIVRRIARLLGDGCDPQDIACICFTNEASRVISNRIGSEIQLGALCTLHAFCVKHINRYCSYEQAVTVLDDEEADEELLRAAKESGCKAKQKALQDCRKNWLTERLLSATPERIAVKSYYHNMHLASMLDYNSILIEAFDSLSNSAQPRRAWEHLIVDELQDASWIDMQIYLHSFARNYFMVGDSDQAVFNFRGGDVTEILKLANDPLWEKHVFETNFRCAPKICEAAQRLIEHNRDRVEKKTVAFVRAGQPADNGQRGVHEPSHAVMDSGGLLYTKEHANDGVEAIAIATFLRQESSEGNDLDDYAVLTRTNRVADDIRETLRQCGIEHVAKIKRQYPADWRVAKAALHLLGHLDSEAAMRRWIRALSPGADGIIREVDRQQKKLNWLVIKEKKLTGDADRLQAELQELSASTASIEIITKKFLELPVTADLIDLEVALALEKDVPINAGGGMTVSTVHGAKGTEFHTVIFVGFEDEIIPGNRKNADIEEERRVAFVGFTRAKERLIITWTRARRQAWGNGKPAPATVSRFLAEAGLL